MAFLAACSTSPESLENHAKDMPGVLRVDARENDGDNDLPFAKTPKHVSILMDAEVSASQIMAVFDEYDGDIDDGDVDVIEVVLDGPKEATLATGEDIHATESMVDELVEAQHEKEVIEYRREAYPVLRSVLLTLAPAGFDAVVSAADRYRNDDEVDDITVASGDFILIRDEVNEDLEFTANRERFVQEVALHFQLMGAVVGGRGPLKMEVAPSDRSALRRFVQRSPHARGLGRILIGAKVRST